MKTGDGIKAHGYESLISKLRNTVLVNNVDKQPQKNHLQKLDILMKFKNSKIDRRSLSDEYKIFF